MNSARDTVRKLVIAVALMFGGVIALVALLSTAAIMVSSADDNITDDYSPSVVALDSMLSDLLRLQKLINDRGSPVPTLHPDGEIAAVHGKLHSDADKYFALPVDPGEQALIESLSASLKRLDDVVHRELAVEPEVAARDTALRSDFEAARQAVDADILRATDFNANLATQAASKSKRDAVDLLIPAAIVLGVASVVAAAVVIVLVYRSVVRAEALANSSRESLERRAEELESFSARVAHDLLSPLMAVRLGVDLARRDAALAKPNTAAALERASRTLERVRQFVADLLEFARAGAAPLPGARTEVAEIVREVADEFGPMARDANAELDVVPAPSKLVRCSPGVLTSVLSNLVQNAIKYLGDARVRRVVIRTRDLGAVVRLEVEDTGPGIPEGDQARLFEPFVRGQTGPVPGLGIGLATVRKLAESHGGHAGVLSHPGHRTLFWITLPVAH
jgi:signal transduction histidine kinase